MTALGFALSSESFFFFWGGGGVSLSGMFMPGVASLWYNGVCAVYCFLILNATCLHAPIVDMVVC